MPSLEVDSLLDESRETSIAQWAFPLDGQTSICSCATCGCGLPKRDSMTLRSVRHAVVSIRTASRNQGVPHVRPMRPACPPKPTVPSMSQRRLTDDPRCEAESDRGSGMEVDTVQDFLDLPPEEIANRLPCPVGAVGYLKAQWRTQSDRARRIRSSQSRVAKMEAADGSVPHGLLVRS